MKEKEFNQLATKLIKTAISQLEETIYEYWKTFEEVITVETFKSVNLKRLEFYQKLSRQLLETNLHLKEGNLEKDDYTTIHNSVQWLEDEDLFMIFNSEKQLDDFKLTNGELKKQYL